MRIPRRQYLLCIALGCPLALGGVLYNQTNPLPASPTPRVPESYRAFAESLINSEPNEQEEKLAIDSAVLGAALAHQQSQRQLTASMLITAAQIAPPDDRQLLWDTAAMIDPSILESWATHRALYDPAIEAAATLLQSARAGTILNNEALQSPDIRSVIESAAKTAGYSGPDVLQLLEALEQVNAADPCRGRIFNPERNPETRQIERVLCPAHARPQCALGSDDQLMIILNTELALTNIRSTSWSTQTSGSGGLPVRDPSIEALLERFNLSLSRPYLRDGQWSGSP